MKTIARLTACLAVLVTITCGWCLTGSAARLDGPAPSPACAHAHADSLPDQLYPLEGGSGVAKGDYNGDGAGDLAVGVPNEDVGNAKDAGAVQVLYGSSSGVTAAGNQYLTQGSGAETGDHFGSAVTAGDFNGDGYSDLVVGVPGEDLGSIADAGQVNVIYGSASGLNQNVQQSWSQDSSGIEGIAEAGDQFGFSLAWGDFGRGSSGDLAIGVPGDSSGSGAVNVIYGLGLNGLNSSGNQLWSQDSAGVLGSPEPGDRFGYALSAGAFGGVISGAYYCADALAIGVPGEDIGSIADAGAVNLICRSYATDALDGADSKLLTQGYGTSAAPGEIRLAGVAEAGDQLGFALALDGARGYTEAIAVGAPGENSGQGAVNVYDAVFDNFVMVENQPGARFGRSVAWGNFDPGFPEDGLVIGAPYEGDAGLTGAGVVYWFESRNTGSPPYPGQSEFDLPFRERISQGASHGEAAGSHFGWSLTAWDFNKDRVTDLAVGIPYEAVSGAVNAGAIDVIPGGLYGTFPLDPEKGKVWTQDSPGITGVAEPGDLFGYSLY